jgi:hypothetical protein
MRKILIALLFITIYSCKNENSNSFKSIGDLPELVTIDSLKSTDFVATMESDISSEKNIIYCPTLLYAWNEIRKLTGELKVREDKDSRSITELNDNNSFENSLSPSEFKTEVQINGENIISKAEFNTELTFKPYLEKMDYPLMFKQKNVNGFGMIGYNLDIAKQLNILYFKNNENFIFKINPEQKDNEIIFIMGSEFASSKTFSEILIKLKEHISIGENEIKNSINLWKYNLKEHETFAIPDLAFNIEKSFNELIGQGVYNDNKIYTIKIAKQRNALLLNNKGAKIESEAEIAVEAADAPPMDNKIIEKHMFLNNTFFIVFKHTSKANPYFIVKINTDELMTKYIEK